MIKKHIPNTITCLNALSGCAASVFALQGQFTVAACLIGAAAVFDFFDGFAARLLGVVSPIGKELDSLSDVISFGLAPSAMVFRFLQDALGSASPWPWLAFLMVAFSAVRLAKFNLDERQAVTFVGMPTPANAFFWAFGLAFYPQLGVQTLPPVPVLILVAVFCFLLVSPLPMISLKFKHVEWKGNSFRYNFLLGAVVLILAFGPVGVSLSILWYVVVSIWFAIDKPQPYEKEEEKTDADA